MKFFLILIMLFIVSCGGIPGKIYEEVQIKATIEIVGLGEEPITIQNNMGTPVTFSKDGSHSVTINTNKGESYSITISEPPSGKICRINKPSGTVGSSGTISLTINCEDFQIAPLYSNAQNWMDYVANNGETIYDATNLACNGTETGPRGYLECLHGGEMKVAELVGISGCEGISAEDSLNAFNWICDDSSSSARIISSGLKDGTYLSGLIDPSLMDWKDMYVSIKQGASSTIGKTSPAKWWGNDVVDQSIVGGTLSTSGTINIVILNPNTPLTISADKVGLVIMPATTLTNDTTCGNTITSGNNFNWIEGEIDATCNETLSSIGIALSNSKFNVITNFKVHNPKYYCDGGRGINLTLSTHNIFKDIVITESGRNGIELNSNCNNNTLENVVVINSSYDGIATTNTSGLIFKNIEIASSGNRGLYLYESVWSKLDSNHLFEEIRVTNSTYDGIHFYQGGNSDLYDISTTNNGGHGIYFFDVANTRSLNVIAANNASDGIHEVQCGGAHTMQSNVTVFNNINNGIYNYHEYHRNFRNVLIANHGGYGFRNDEAYDFAIVNNIAIAHNDSYAMRLKNTTYLTGIVKFGDIAGDNYFYSNVTGLPSDFHQVNGISLENSFIGKITTSDLINESETETILFENNTDWINFENFFRFWGRSHIDDFPSTNHRGRCAGIETCQIWDLRLSINDIGTVREALDFPTGNDYLIQIWRASNSDQCALVEGATWGGGVCNRPGYFTQVSCEAVCGVWTPDKCYTIHLRNAVEVMGDGIGNDNTLCESGETCIYTPNFGAYQGHGNLVPAGNFIDGDIIGITLLMYENNGL